MYRRMTNLQAAYLFAYRNAPRGSPGRFGGALVSLRDFINSKAPQFSWAAVQLAFNVCTLSKEGEEFVRITSKDGLDEETELHLAMVAVVLAASVAHGLNWNDVQWLYTRMSYADIDARVDELRMLMTRATCKAPWPILTSRSRTSRAPDRTT